MSTPTADFAAITAFVLELEKLKGVLRKNRPLGQTRYENTAEHSWQICLLAMSVLPHASEPVEIGAVVQLLLVHDIPEIDAGDVNVYDAAGRAAAEAKEEAAAQRIFGLLPAETGAQMYALWREFTTGTSAEARYARAIDRMMPVLQNLNSAGQSWRENGIRIDQVTRMNHPKISGMFPTLWPQIEQQLIAAVARGDLGAAQDE
ncbi:putative hydrolase of HD superfamily [Silvimonas terrae]|uniref:Putative hydrolase of HD superfamily n=1 Tax=Silvimonas terrae TaxID=300266 RepID=A0A840RGF1_9NEIS|nr:HD domain-containing protein [Silvimonas terrae]MBB5191500.1 putative hydrolase of HD superfamily [Silvimonas terrae]